MDFCFALIRFPLLEIAWLIRAVGKYCRPWALNRLHDGAKREPVEVPPTLLDRQIIESRYFGNPGSYPAIDCSVKPSLIHELFSKTGARTFALAPVLAATRQQQGIKSSMCSFPGSGLVAAPAQSVATLMATRMKVNMTNSY